jgi:D-glycero-D-manno-heptose 1,7-bisphosphate phosphatase
VSPRRAVFVDRDGVINELVPDPDSGAPESPLRVADVALVPGAAVALLGLRVDGWTIVGVSNQPAAAKGRITLARLHAIQARVLELLDREGVVLDDFRLCLHHPDGVVPALSGPCDCRKPAPGMLRDAARELGLDLAASWMIGDAESDVAAGRAAGCHTALIEHPASAHRRTAGGGAATADVVVADLAGAARAVVDARTE